MATLQRKSRGVLKQRKSLSILPTARPNYTTVCTILFHNLRVEVSLVQSEAPGKFQYYFPLWKAGGYFHKEDVIAGRHLIPACYYRLKK